MYEKKKEVGFDLLVFEMNNHLQYLVGDLVWFTVMYTDLTCSFCIKSKTIYRFGKHGEFAVIVSPTDQGYYEPDTSALIRLKMEQEYGYGNTPGTYLTDKVNLLGSGAIPLWRWIEGNCRTPAGLGKIQVSTN